MDQDGERQALVGISRRAYASRMAEDFLRENSFALYQQDKSQKTLRTQKAGLTLFAAFLWEIEHPRPGRTPAGYERSLLWMHLLVFRLSALALMHDASAWEGITHGTVVLFKQWLLSHGYAVGAVNVRLTAVRKYAELARDAGVIPHEEYALIQEKAKLINYKERFRLDQTREVKRIGRKKEHAILLTTEQVEHLFTSCPDTPQGARDAFLLTLLFRYGLRCEEVAGLTLINYKRSTGTLTFFREKTVDFTTLVFEPEDRVRVERYYELCHPESQAINPTNCVIMGSNNRGEVFGTMGERSITERVNTLGKRFLGIENLSGHDGRHYGATEYVAGGTDLFTLMGIFNWRSTETARKYVEASKIANQNAKRGKVE